jgi:hypothetical protein
MLREFVSGAEAGVAIKPVVIRLEQIGDDQKIPVAGFDPEGQFVAASVAVVKEAALVDHSRRVLMLGVEDRLELARVELRSSTDG